MISTLTFIAMSSVVNLIRLLPLTWVAWLGRTMGGVVYSFDRRHRIRAKENLHKIFGGEWDERKIAEVAKENFRRLGENYASAIRTAFMSQDDLKNHVEVVGAENFKLDPGAKKPRNRIVVIGHFGNFELYARVGSWAGLENSATTYRALKNRGANRVLESLRHRSDTLFFERKKDVSRMKNRLREGGLTLGLLSDHYGGGGGMASRFMGHEASSTAAPVVLAMRYDADMHPAICYRIGLAKWRIEVGKEISLRNEAGSRPVEEVTQEIQDILSKAVRKDPANWFWVHKRWRPPLRKKGSGGDRAD